MGLTPEEISLVRKTWAPVIAKPEEHGAIILKTFLDKHNYYSKFERFKDADRATIKDNPIFRNHAKKLMMTIDAAIKTLHNVDDLVPLLTGLGEAHAKRKIKILQFEELKVVVLDILTTAFKISETEKAAWVKMFEVALPIISKGISKNSA